MQRDVVIRFESAAVDPAKIDVRSVEGREHISQLFEFTVHLVCDDPAGVSEEGLLKNPCALVFELVDGTTRRELRRIHGMVRSARDRLQSESRQTEYAIEIVPRAWQSSLTRKNDIYQETSVPDIITQKLEEGAALGDTDVELRLSSSYPARDFVVQYEESDLAFMQRWAEHLGIFYFFDHRGGHDKIIWADDNAHFLAHDPVHYVGRGETEGVYDLESRREMVTVAFKSRDYNYRNPLMDVLGEAAIGAIGAGTLDEYGSHIRTPDEATQIARVRAEEATARHHVFAGKSHLPTFTAGAKVKVDGHPTAGDLELVLVSVEHRYVQATHGSTGEVQEYLNEFTAIRASVPYRPPLLTPKPRVPGVVSGVVQSSSATDFGAIDDQGQYRVAFMYDSVARDEGKASRAIRMAQPSAGADRGFHIPLKAGTEVVVYCINGDPDRPIIAGAVPNPQTGSPVTSANAEKTILNTNRSSLAIDDAQPRAKLSVAGSDHIFQVGQPNEAELGFVASTINNFTTMADESQNAITGTYSNWSDMKDALASSDITQFAGLPVHWLKKADAIAKFAKSLPGTVKSVSKVIGAGYGLAIDSSKDAEKTAKKEQKDLQDQMFAAMATVVDGGAKAKPKDGNPYRYPEKPPRMVTPDDGDGTARPETEDEFRKRVATEMMSTPSNAKLLQAAADKVRLAGEAREKAEKAWSESALNAESGPYKDFVAGTEKIANSVSTLLSTIVKFANTTSRLITYESLVGAQMGANAICLKSPQRRVKSVGDFAKHCNIQAATNSAGLFGGENALVFGVNTACVAANEVGVIAATGVQVKSAGHVEAAAPTVQVSASAMIDMHSGKEMKLVAHSGANRDMAVPADYSIYMVGENKILCHSTTKNFEVQAKLNVKLTAETEDMLIDSVARKVGVHGKTQAYFGAGAGDGWGLVASEKNLMLGKLATANDPAAASVKDDNALQIKDDQFVVRIKESRAFLSPTTAYIKSGGTVVNLKKDGDVTVKSSANLVLKSSKILLN
jgi:type VI secretion system VgrG family protein